MSRRRRNHSTVFKAKVNAGNARSIAHATLAREKEEAAGEHSVLWDGRNQSGAELASGTYFYRLVIAGAEKLGRMVLAR